METLPNELLVAILADPQLALYSFPMRLVKSTWNKLAPARPNPAKIWLDSEALKTHVDTDPEGVRDALRGRLTNAIKMTPKDLQRWIYSTSDGHGFAGVPWPRTTGGAARRELRQQARASWLARGPRCASCGAVAAGHRAHDIETPRCPCCFDPCATCAQRNLEPRCRIPWIIPHTLSYRMGVNFPETCEAIYCLSLARWVGLPALELTTPNQPQRSFRPLFGKVPRSHGWPAPERGARTPRGGRGAGRARPST
jgi:hypothetical protein